MQIVTFGTMASRSALKDTFRVFDVPYGESNKIAQMIPENTSIQEAYDTVDEFRIAINNDPVKLEAFKIAKQLEGLPRQTGVHASGVIIADAPVVEYAPVMTDKKTGTKIVQFPMTIVDEIGLIKMDFLGLRTLDVMRQAVKMIKENHNVKVDIDNIPLNDKKTFQMLRKGDTDAVFQFESDGMRSYMRQMQPKTLEDLTALNALYRPGPMDNIPEYISRKNNSNLIQYTVDTPEVRRILAPTVGIPTYQEQIMQIFQDVAGFTLGRADIVRKAMGKKKEDVLQEEFRHFVEGLHDENNNIMGTRAKGIPDRDAYALLDEMKNFAKYALK